MEVFTVLGPILGIILAVAIAVGALATRYKIAKSTEAIIVTGRANKEKEVATRGKEGEQKMMMTADLSGQKVVIGGGVFVWPFIQQHEIISLKSQSINIGIKSVPSLDGILLDVEGVAVIKIGGTQSSVRLAAQRFGGNLDEIKVQTVETLSGALRSIVGQMSVEQIIRDREGFAQRAVETAQDTLLNQGLVLDTFQIRDIADGEDYLINLGRPQAAEVEKNAKIAESEALEAAERKRIEVEENVAVANRGLELKKAAIKAEIDKAAAEAAAQEPLEVAQQRQKILEQQEAVEARKAQVTERALESEIRRPADARRYEAEQQAEAKKTARTLDAEAARQEQVAQAQAKAEAARLQGEGEIALAQAKATADEQEARGRLALADAEAKAISLKGEAEAAAIQAKLLAEAEGMEKKAEAYKQYGEAAVLETIVNVLPAVAREFAAPMGNIKDLTVIDSNGANKLTQGVSENLAALPAVIEQLTGVKLTDLATSFAKPSNTKGLDG